jgi:glycerate kinase
MRILVAPDKFKGSLSAQEVANNIATGLRHVVPDATIEIIPIADGGEGTAEVICRACAGDWVTCDSRDAIGRAIKARYAWLPNSVTAVMEISEAAGLWRLSPDERDPLNADTGGVGLMLQDAKRRSAKEIIVGLGGSATNDGGFGMARILGYHFLNADGAGLTGSIVDLVNLQHCVPPNDLILPRITIAADVKNPLLGIRGATRTFGPQKGVATHQLELFEAALTRFAEVVAKDLGCDFREVPGAGAAGGLGFGLMSFCGATVRSGFDIVSEMLDLETAIKQADAVITGEGSLDNQTLEGKAPAGIAQLARKLGKRTFAIVGRTPEPAKPQELFDSVYVLVRPPVTTEEAMKRTAVLLQERARELAETALSG